MATTTVLPRGFTNRLVDIWRSPRGFAALTAVNHKTIGLRYIVTGFAFFGAAVLLALTMLTQLSRARLSVLSPEAYNQVFTMHGTTMMFLFAVPIMEGIGIYLVPMMIGARDAAFPRLNAFGYYVYLIAGLTLYASLLMGQAPDSGWFNYVPLAGPQYSPGLGIDVWATAVTFLEIAALVAAVEIIVTIFKLRAPGMSIDKMPVFVWSILVMAFMIVFAMPPLMIGSVMLALDRMVGTHFFNVVAGGNPLLWQHLFWWFGHPEVYIIVIPAFGMVSMIIPTFARRRLLGYVPVVASMVVIGIVSFGLWVHHMFAAGISMLGMSLFSASSMAIAVPSGIQIFAWISTLWHGRPRLRVPLLWALGFIVLFVIGGVTGPMLAFLPFDWQVHDSYFVTAHFHFVLIGGSVFPLFGAIYYWFPKMTGRMLDERLGRWSFALAFVGFLTAFLIMHYTGLVGMPRRVATYMPGRGWDPLMQVSLAGALILATGFGLTLLNVIRSVRSGEPASDNPWEGDTLEWTLPSPAPVYNFQAVPDIRSRTPAWDMAESGQEPSNFVYYTPGTEKRETIGTTVLDAEPEQRILLPGSSIWPLVLAVAVGITFIGTIVDLIFVPIGAVLSFIAIAAWNWPGGEGRP